MCGSRGAGRVLLDCIKYASLRLAAGISGNDMKAAMLGTNVEKLAAYLYAVSVKRLRKKLGILRRYMILCLLVVSHSASGLIGVSEAARTRTHVKCSCSCFHSLDSLGMGLFPVRTLAIYRMFPLATNLGRFPQAKRPERSG